MAERIDSDDRTRALLSHFQLPFCYFHHFHVNQYPISGQSQAISQSTIRVLEGSWCSYRRKIQNSSRIMLLLLELRLRNPSP